MQLQRKLNFSLRQHRRGDHARGAGAVGNVVVRLCEYCVVEGVEQLRPEFQGLMLRDTEELAEREVAGHPAWTDEDILSGISKSISSRQGKTVHVEPVVDGPLAGRKIAVAGAVRPGQSDGAGVGRVI